MTHGPKLPPKKTVAEALLERSWVFVHLDPRCQGVVVPLWLKKQAELVLQIGLNMPVPIRDLVVDEAGVSCTLSFNRSPNFCHVPWAAVYALVAEDGRGMVWPDSVPPEVAGRMAEAVVPKKDQKVPDGGAARQPRPAPTDDARPSPKGPGLRLVGKERAKPRKLAEAQRRQEAGAPNVPSLVSPVEAARSNPGKSSSGKKPTLPPYLRVVK